MSAAAAVSNFFGEDIGQVLGNNQALSVGDRSNDLSRGKRGGVGTSRVPKTLGIGKDLLKIGKHKRRGGGNNDDVHDNSAEDDDSDDEGEALITEKLASLEKRGEGGGSGGLGGESADIENKAKKRKKLGKKEREKMKLMEDKGNEEDGIGGEEGAGAVADWGAEDGEEGGGAKKSKKKRKKVRSRQKNIRKDKRVLDGTLPEHLINKAGKGSKARPMTAETKKRLGLEKKKEVRKEVVNELDGGAKKKARLKKEKAMGMMGGKFRNLK